MNFKSRIFEKKDSNKSNLIVIKTARDIESINNACHEGYFPLIKPVKPLEMIRTKFSVLQNISTGEVEMIKDFRSVRNRTTYFIDDFDGEANTEQPEFKTVIDWTYYYPYQFELPFAAYLIPKDLKKGNRVYIEDFIGHAWNQGDTYRLES